MLINYVLGGSLGGLVAFMFAIPAILLEITESGKVKNVPLLVDVKTIFGLKIRHKQEVFFIGLLLHLIFGFLFGFVFFFLFGFYLRRIFRFLLRADRRFHGRRDLGFKGGYPLPGELGQLKVFGLIGQAL